MTPHVHAGGRADRVRPRPGTAPRPHSPRRPPRAASSRSGTMSPGRSIGRASSCHGLRVPRGRDGRLGRAGGRSRRAPDNAARAHYAQLDRIDWSSDGTTCEESSTAPECSGGFTVAISTPRRRVTQDDAGGCRRTPLQSGRGQLAVLIALALLTVGAWALTVHQAQTMDMPMGVVARDGGDAPAMPVSDDGMATWAVMAVATPGHGRLGDGRRGLVAGRAGDLRRRLGGDDGGDDVPGRRADAAALPHGRHASAGPAARPSSRPGSSPPATCWSGRRSGVVTWVLVQLAATWPAAWALPSERPGRRSRWERSWSWPGSTS